ncbi:MAG: serine/threonine-protein kinase [Deltaproteobacteria bacterium]|nr:serine/threonine-protein kinase [Deltaproteobacteria bacterium]
MSTASHPSIRSAPDLPILGADRFEIQEKIGAGGMGTVYKALQKSVGRAVAVKVLSSEYASNAAGVSRFVREATVVSRLVHPNIVSMIEFGRDPDGNLLLVMELLEGESLRQTLRREKRLPAWRAVQIAMQVLAALRIAHGAGVVHRDLKPENIFISCVDGADHAKVLDFGVAKMLEHDVGLETTAGSLVGTLKYMAPEQIAGDPPDARVDLYALGVLLYEMLAGALPYEAKERVAMLRAILSDPPVPLDHRVADLPPALVEITMRAIAKLSIDRFQSADSFRQTLAPFAMAGTDPRAPSFAITREIRLPDSDALRATAEAAMYGAQSSRPSTIPQGILAPPPNPSGISQVSIAAHANADQGYTTGVGLSSSTHHVTRPTGSRRALTAGLVATGIACLAGGVGVVAAKLNRRTIVRPAVANAVNATGQNAGVVSARLVMLQSIPAGAEVRDVSSNEVLCERTPCMVPVYAGQLRHVRVTSLGRSIDTPVDPSMSPLVLQFGDVAATQPGTQESDVVAPTASADPPQTPHRNRNRNTHTRPTHEPGQSTHVIPMFGVRPGG